MLDYVGHADVTARLLDVDPFWSWEPMATTAEGLPLLDGMGNLWIRLTVCGVTRLGVGDGKNMKELVSDALRNAAMRYGLALSLWAKGDRDWDAQQPEPEPERPEWYARTLDAVYQLPAEHKDSVRAWIEQEGITLVPTDWTEDQARAIRHRIHQVAGA